MNLLKILAVLLTFSMVSCSVEPEPINYNYDECSFCKMKISDARFGAELVTTKGKIYKYDSAECLLRTFLENDPAIYAHAVVTDYLRPRTLINAFSASYFISEKQASPMGGNLSAYEKKEQAIAAKTEKGGELLSFQELLHVYKQKQ